MRWMSEKPITLRDLNPDAPEIPIRGVIYDEAAAVCTSLGGELPSREDFDAFGLLKLGNYDPPVWSWTTEQSGAERVLRGGDWSLGDRDVLSAAGRSTYAPSFRFTIFGFRCMWRCRANVPQHISVVRVEL